MKSTTSRGQPILTDFELFLKRDAVSRELPALKMLYTTFSLVNTELLIHGRETSARVFASRFASRTGRDLLCGGLSEGSVLFVEGRGGLGRIFTTQGAGKALSPFSEGKFVIVG